MQRFSLWKTISLIVGYLFILCIGSLQAQPLAIKDEFTEYIRLLQSRGQIETSASWNIQPIRYEWLTIDSSSVRANPWSDLVESTFNISKKGNSEFPEILFYSPTYFQSYNTKAPSGSNDGALWQGRGYNSSLSAGIWARYRFLEVSIKPEFIFSQNKGYSISPYTVPSEKSPYANPFLFSDMPQRFGDESISDITLGNSYIKINAGPIAVGFSNQYNWFGPAFNNPILMSNNAPGFRHVYLETFKPIETIIGDFESRFYWGSLESSDYYFTSSDSARRYLTGLIINYSPSFLNNVHVSVARTYNQYWPKGGLDGGYIFYVFEPTYKSNIADEDNPEGNDQTDQIIVLALRWVFPDTGTEFYAEFARNDHSWDFRDFILEAEHSRVFTLGVSTTADISPNRFINFRAEISQLETPKTQQFRGGMKPIYSNGDVDHGYTNMGQILGAGIGPGSSTQYFSASYYDVWGKIAFYLSRIVNNNDSLIDHTRQIRREQGISQDTEHRLLHDVEIHTGIKSAVLATKNLELQFSIYRMFERNRYYMLDNNISNYHFEITTRYYFKNFLR